MNDDRGSAYRDPRKRDNLCSSRNNLQNIFSCCDRTANKQIRNDKIDYSDPGHIAELLIPAGVAVGA